MSSKIARRSVIVIDTYKSSFKAFWWNSSNQENLMFSLKQLPTILIIFYFGKIIYKTKYLYKKEKLCLMHSNTYTPRVDCELSACVCRQHCFQLVTTHFSTLPETGITPEQILLNFNSFHSRPCATNATAHTHTHTRTSTYTNIQSFCRRNLAWRHRVKGRSSRQRWIHSRCFPWNCHFFCYAKRLQLRSCCWLCNTAAANAVACHIIVRLA